VVGVDLLALLGAVLGHSGRPLDEDPELVEGVVEEREHRDRLVLPLIQVRLHEVLVLIAQEDAHVERAALLRDHPEDGKIRDHVAAPVLGQREHMDRSIDRPERLEVLGGDLDAGLVRLDPVAVPGHLVLERGIGQAGREAGSVDRRHLALLAH